MMPSHFTLEALPTPTDEKVHLRAIPGRRMAAVQYAGTWSQQRCERNLARLREWMKACGQPRTSCQSRHLFDPDSDSDFGPDIPSTWRASSLAAVGRQLHHLINQRNAHLGSHPKAFYDLARTSR